VVSEEGISIYLEIFESIKNIWLPTNKISLQLFFNKINFIRRFIPKFVEKVNTMNAFLREDVIFRWDNDRLRSYRDIKEEITTTPVLSSPDYSHEFIIFSFTYQDTMSRVLLNKNKDYYDHPISFMRKTLGMLN
jgi:hypothetical protein